MAKKSIIIIISIMLLIICCSPEFIAFNYQNEQNNNDEVFFQQFNDDFIANAEVVKDENGCFILKGKSHLLEKAEDFERREVNVLIIIPLNDEESQLIEDTINSLQSRNNSLVANIYKNDGSNNSKLLLINNLNTINNYINSLSGGSHYKHAWDSSISVEGYFTIDYSLYYNDEYVKMDSVYGGFYSSYGTGANVNPGVKVKSQQIDAGQTGKTLNNGTVTQTTTFNPSASTRTWSYNIPTAWYAVECDSALTTVGVNYYITLQRGNGTPWTLHVQDLICHNGISIV